MARMLITENAKWLKNYDNSRELEALSMLSIMHQLQSKTNIRIADIGCGNGRSIILLNALFPNAYITAIDKIKENIYYASQYINSKNIEYLVCDAVDFFSKKQGKFFDLAFFSWSFFDMINEPIQSIKERKLKSFLDSIIAKLNNDGVIIVLQPTKGGTFEQLLSLFMPSSDKVYAFTHKFLKSYGFIGPEDFIPHHNDPLGIWSEFKYRNDDDLYNGIASILNLENNEILTHEKYNEKVHIFRKKNKLSENALLSLSDCVNIYYLRKGESYV